MESRVFKPVLAVYVALFVLFLYGPFVVLTILSFQQGPEGGPQFPIIEWSTYWYRHLDRLQLVGHILQIGMTLPNGEPVSLEGHADKYRDMLATGSPAYVAWDPADATLIVQ